MRLASGNVALTVASWAPIAESCPEGPTRLDREIRVGVPARRADGSGRRTAGRWVAPPAVAAVRFKRPSGRGTRLSRARLGKAVGVPRGADDPQGPNRPGAGGFARRPLGRGSWGLSFSEFGPSSPGARARIGHLPRRNPPSSTRRPGPHKPPLVLVRADPPVGTVGSRPGSRSLPVARQVRSLSSSTTVLSRRYGESWLAASWPGVPATLTFQPLPSSLANRRPRTAWRRPGRGRGSPRDGHSCVIRQPGKRRAARQSAVSAAGPTVPISLDQMTLRRWRPPRWHAVRSQRVRSADDWVHPVAADRDAVPAAKVNKEAWSDGDQTASPTAAWLATP